MTRSLAPARALAQLDRHRSGNPNNPPSPPPTLEERWATFAQVLRAASISLGEQVGTAQERRAS
jgi:hypothetical protein